MSCLLFWQRFFFWTSITKATICTVLYYVVGLTLICLYYNDNNIPVEYKYVFCIGNLLSLISYIICCSRKANNFYYNIIYQSTIPTTLLIFTYTILICISSFTKSEDLNIFTSLMIGWFLWVIIHYCSFINLVEDDNNELNNIIYCNKIIIPLYNNHINNHININHNEDTYLIHK
jgi:hypothetical protein